MEGGALGWIGVHSNMPSTYLKEDLAGTEGIIEIAETESNGDALNDRRVIAANIFGFSRRKGELDLIL